MEILKELAKNQEGKGFLLEKDAGFIDPFNENNINAINELRKIGQPSIKIQEPLILTCILQKHGVVNANGRVYPENILKREWDKYQTRIKMNAGFGECYLPNTKILTESGWKMLSEVSLGENILTLNPETQKIEINPIKNIIRYNYDGEMVRIKGNHINDLVTPNHKFILNDRYHNFKGFYSAEDIFNGNIKDKNHSYIPKQDINFDNIDTFLKSNITEINIDERFLQTTKEHYNGDVMCIEVDNHTWYCMCNDKCHWTGNCNHPESSAIDLSRIAINVVDGWWEKQTLMGKVEIIMSPAFVNQGIISCQGDIVANLLRKGLRIGVSSRGLGSVKTIMGKQLVQEDFELVCWDAVADPSTPGAYIFYENDNLEQFVENKNSKNNIILEVADKFLNKIEKKSILL